mmetsp:Transcript_11471/g.37691  ORF Transcript_11471/g.37691 Transcript_11471/m.37691 type:complete len:333 (+) Transcript_11471:1636-2634(+)
MTNCEDVGVLWRELRGFLFFLFFFLGGGRNLLVGSEHGEVLCDLGCGVVDLFWGLVHGRVRRGGRGDEGRGDGDGVVRGGCVGLGRRGGGGGVGCGGVRRGPLVGVGFAPLLAGAHLRGLAFLGSAVLFLCLPLGGPPLFGGAVLGLVVALGLPRGRLGGARPRARRRPPRPRSRSPGSLLLSRRGSDDDSPSDDASSASSEGSAAEGSAAEGRAEGRGLGAVGALDDLLADVEGLLRGGGRQGREGLLLVDDVDLGVRRGLGGGTDVAELLRRHGRLGHHRRVRRRVHLGQLLGTRQLLRLRQTKLQLRREPVAHQLALLRRRRLHFLVER